MNKKKIAILIPCFNEELGIGKVIDKIPFSLLEANGFAPTVTIIDNNSSDQTAAIAASKGVRVVSELAKGKGNAMRKGFASIESDIAYVVMLDGDNTYDPREMLRLIEPLTNNFCDVVIGSRLGGRISKDALKAQNHLVNKLYTSLVRQFYGANITDVLSGFFAWRGDVVIGMRDHLQSGGFSIEMEMISKMVKLNYAIYSMPITYDVREGETKIESLKDGIKILGTFSRNLFWAPSQALVTAQISRGTAPQRV